MTTNTEIKPWRELKAEHGPYNDGPLCTDIGWADQEIQALRTALEAAQQQLVQRSVRGMMMEDAGLFIKGPDIMDLVEKYMGKEHTIGPAQNKAISFAFQIIKRNQLLSRLQPFLGASNEPGDGLNLDNGRDALVRELDIALNGDEEDPKTLGQLVEQVKADHARTEELYDLYMSTKKPIFNETRLGDWLFGEDIPASCVLREAGPDDEVNRDSGRDAALQIAIDACCMVESSAYKHNNHERASGAKFCADAIREAMAAQQRGQAPAAK